MPPASRHIHISGIVQGVGFRPFVYNLALNNNLSGWVRNSANGVDIEVTGEQDALDAFISEITHSPPPLAIIDSIETQSINQNNFKSFEIIQSNDNPNDFIPVSPDMAICKDCQEEMFNPADRRYRYPFINCTNCGPRFTIIKDIPYDRPATTMASFTMCPDCLEEYENPSDRRFHAQPIACPICGPQVWLETGHGERMAKQDEAVQKARKLLAEGKILAIKGLGGFHLVCDATNQAAVMQLRQRKKRPAKPFALMAFDLAAINAYVQLTPAAETLLTNPQAPILLLPAKPDSDIAEAVAPGNNKLGMMLPYTPLHLLLMEPAPWLSKALVMTSGNLSEEPIIHENQTAREKLSYIVDGFLMHNRPIHRRIDDSVYTVVRDRPYPIRRARGFAPNPIRLSQSMPQVLGAGPQMKNNFCMTRDKYAFISHYIGEMENWETYQDYRQAINDYEKLFRIQPTAIGHDLHPDYTATLYANERVQQKNIKQFGIQHHYAHLVACIIENQIELDEKIAGLIFDGTGYGTDDTIWGGEVLVGDSLNFERIYHLKPIPLPGGDLAVSKPARMALSILWAYQIPWQDNFPPVIALSKMEREILKTQLKKGVNTPLTTSMGRLFDAVSALIGVCMETSYEAQAAIELEALTDQAETGFYPWQINGGVIDMRDTITAIINDFSNGKSQSSIATRFHNTIAQLALDIAQKIHTDYGIKKIALSGGVWQNMYLLSKTLTLLEENGLQPLIHKLTPPNDECISLGQAINTANRYLQDKE